LRYQDCPAIGQLLTATIVDYPTVMELLTPEGYSFCPSADALTQRNVEENAPASPAISISPMTIRRAASSAG